MAYNSYGAATVPRHARPAPLRTHSQAVFRPVDEDCSPAAITDPMPPYLTGPFRGLDTSKSHDEHGGTVHAVVDGGARPCLLPFSNPNNVRVPRFPRPPSQIITCDLHGPSPSPNASKDGRLKSSPFSEENGLDGPQFDHLFVGENSDTISDPEFDIGQRDIDGGSHALPGQSLLSTCKSANQLEIRQVPPGYRRKFSQLDTPGQH